ncbi:MAG TPA: polysaccharide deacetylase family protein [Bacteroidales bacterium]|nr:polysaccharide deacetylase family protein [Bacteroidales bacterium]
MKKSGLLLSLLFAGISLFSQQHRSVTELLGYPADTKLLIIHADDIGLSHSTNMAVINAFENQSITSGAVMVPCPWFPEFAAYFREHNSLDIGIHFTLNSEWKYYRTGGVLPSTEIPNLLDKDGYLFPTVEQVALFARPEQVEKELRAQIDRAIAMGVKPSHLDSHMGSMYVNPVIFRIAVKVAKEYGLPISLPFNLLGPVAPFLKSEVTPDMVGVDNFFMLDGNAVNGDWMKMYTDIVKSLKPGLNEIVVHLSYDNDEMKAVAIGQEAYGSAWRQKDLNLVNSPEFKQLLKDNQVVLMTWRQIQKALYPEK